MLSRPIALKSGYYQPTGPFEGGQFIKAEDEVRSAVEKIYSALNRMLNGIAGSLPDIWSHSATATTTHPIGGREID
jgi:hypothetical protein